MHCFAEPFHARSIIWNVVALNFLHDVVVLRTISALIAVFRNTQEKNHDQSDGYVCYLRHSKTTHYFHP